MAFTKINFYVVLLIVIALVSISLGNFGTSLLNNSDITLSNNSITYIQNYTNSLDSSGISDFDDEQTASDLKEDNIITEGNETEGFSITDFLANINYYSEKTNKIVAWIKITYNMPSFLISALGIPIQPVRHVINIIGIALFILILVLLIRLVRGS